MRKIVAILLTISLLSALCGCSSDNPEIISPVKFYYMRNELTYGKEDSVLHFELYEAAGHEADYEYLIDRYLEGPDAEGLVGSIPKNVTLTEFKIEGDTANLTLNSNFSTLYGIHLTIACAALTRTVCEMVGVTTVNIRCNGKQLDGNQVITITMDDILLLDQSAVPTE